MVTATPTGKPTHRKALTGFRLVSASKPHRRAASHQATADPARLYPRVDRVSALDSRFYKTSKPEKPLPPLAAEKVERNVQTAMAVSRAQSFMQASVEQEAMRLSADL